ncbi:MAG: hypothetical protein NTW11_02385 [Candidatus Staskawiczbacteria bacterium]|nr:hypothetical protein [Candidatus Staskawiczbacteria bacterium]
MKKIIFTTLLLSTLISCFPLSAFGAIVEVTATINSVQIPQRAATMGKSVSTEFYLPNSRMVIAQTNGSVVATGSLPSGRLKQGASATFSFAYDPTLAPYNVYAEVSVSNTAGTAICKADCGNVTSGASWAYFSSGSLYYNTAGSWSIASCPATTDSPPSQCTASSANSSLIALDTAKVVNGYWRSPTIYTITLNQ